MWKPAHHGSKKRKSEAAPSEAHGKRKKKPRHKKELLAKEQKVGISEDSEDASSRHCDVAKLNNTDSSLPYLTQTRFDKFSISPLSIKALHTIHKYETMTTVQEATFTVILKGQDVLAKARTGTGKTIAFLLPAIEAVLKEPPAGGSYNPVYVLIVCPTRELAQQAASEAKILLTFHSGLGAQVVYGGTSFQKEQRQLSRDPCQILVSTPGRLVEHFKRTPDMVKQLRHVKVLVLDEADHMFDMGFRESLKKILKVLPLQRQTLLFSATIPPEVHSMAKVALKQNHNFIDTVGKDSLDTHTKVKQSHVLAPLDKQLIVLYGALKQHTEVEPDFKVLVFCTTARVAGFMFHLFNSLGFNGREIHSRKNRSYRTHVSDEFRHAKGGIILFTSGMSARELDYPDVTFVVQVGAPSDKQQYIDRLGRTGHAGKDGQGLLVLAPWEAFFLENLKGLPISELPAIEICSQMEKRVLSTASLVDKNIRSQAYQAWIGYYRSLKGLYLDKKKLVEYANQFSSSMGFKKPPTLSRTLISKMNLHGVRGIRVEGG